MGQWSVGLASFRVERRVDAREKVGWAWTCGIAQPVENCACGCQVWGVLWEAGTLCSAGGAAGGGEQAGAREDAEEHHSGSTEVHHRMECVALWSPTGGVPTLARVGRVGVGARLSGP